jgi:hypothetical protein
LIERIENRQSLRVKFQGESWRDAKEAKFQIIEIANKRIIEITNKRNFKILGFGLKHLLVFVPTTYVR